MIVRPATQGLHAPAVDARAAPAALPSPMTRILNGLAWIGRYGTEGFALSIFLGLAARGGGAAAACGHDLLLRHDHLRARRFDGAARARGGAEAPVHRRRTARRRAARDRDARGRARR